jgi:hypothetical protein
VSGAGLYEEDSLVSQASHWRARGSTKYSNTVSELQEAVIDVGALAQRASFGHSATDTRLDNVHACGTLLSNYSGLVHKMSPTHLG